MIAIPKEQYEALVSPTMSMSEITGRF